MVGWVKAVLFLLGGVGAAAGTAYVTGVLDPWLAPQPAGIASLPQTTQPPATESLDEPAAGEDEAAPEAETQSGAGEPATTEKEDRLSPPVFDVLRVEPDGSVLVAGKSGANALVEVLSGPAVLGKASAGLEGDFVVLLEERLAPGDYRLTLRATGPRDAVTLSDGTAIVSIPERQDGQVLAMVEEPGQPAQLISVPEAPAASGSAQEEPADEAQVAGSEAAPDAASPEGMAPEETVSGADVEEDATPDVAQPGQEPAEQEQAGQEQAGQEQAGEPEQAAAEQEASPEAAAGAPADDEADTPVEPQPSAVHTVAVEAVEIEGDTIFVAGRADAGRTVRVYAGTVLLGDAVASDGGRFLVEAKRHLEVGNYLIRADLLGADGSVVARAAVPFEREPGESIAAVAPPQAQPAGDLPAEGSPEEADEQEVAETESDAGEAAEAQPDAEAATQAEVAVAPADTEAGEAEPEATAAPLQRVDGAVIIRRGDSLWRISRRVYGHGVRYSTIYLANQDQIHDPNRIWPGQVFTVPGETPEGEQADLEAIGDQAVRPEDREAAGE